MKKITLTLAITALFSTLTMAHTHVEAKIDDGKSTNQTKKNLNHTQKKELSNTIKELESSHSGGTDRYGCHVDSLTGLRHCH